MTAERILIVEGSGRGFLSHYAHALALGLHREGRAVRLVTAPCDELAGWPAPFERAATLRRGPAGWLDLWRETRDFRPDAVHFQWLADPVGAALYVAAMRRRGTAAVYTPHNLLPHRGRWMTMPLFRRLYAVFDRIVVRDAHMVWAAHEMLGVEIDRMVHLPGSPNVIASPGAPRRLPPEAPARRDGEVRALHFGHGCARKGLAPLLAALAEGPEVPGLHLMLAGAGVDRGLPEGLVEAARRKARISVIGRYLDPDEIGGLFASADLATMPYVKLCRSPILDLAAALATPVLRTDRVEATRFDEGLHGRSVTGGDPAAFAAMLRLLAADPAPLAAMSAALERTEGFDPAVARLAEAHGSLYDHAARALRSGEAAAAAPAAAIAGE